MGLDKAIEHRKEKRKQYRGSRACDKTCRNHGSDDWAKDNRLYRSNKLLEKSEQDLEEVPDEIDFKPDWPKVETTIIVTKVSKSEPKFDDIEVVDEI